MASSHAYGIRSLASIRVTTVRQLVLFSAALLLGTLAASLYQSFVDSVSTRHRLRRYGGTVEWELFDIGEDWEEERAGEDAWRLTPRGYSSSALLEEAVRGHHEVSRAFLERLVSHGLSCSPGNEGLLLRKYGGFLKALERYTAFHKRSRAADRILVWYCDINQYCGGLADRLKGMAYALLLALFSNRRFLISWGYNATGERMYLKPNIIDWILLDEIFEDLWVEQVFWDDTEGIEYVSAEMMAKNVRDTNDPSTLYLLHLGSILTGIGVDVSPQVLNQSLLLIESSSPSLLALGTNMEPSSLLNETKIAQQSWISAGMRRAGLADLSPEEVDGIIGIVFRYLFHFTDDLMAEVAVAHQVLGLGTKMYTGVHVRTGFAGTTSQEVVDHPKLIRRPEQWQRMLQCAVVSADQRIGVGSLIFLATDSPIVKYMAMKLYGSQFRTLDNSIIHLDRMSKFPHEPFQNETEGTLTSFVELILLAQSHVQVCSPGSGYTMVSSQLCSLPNSRVLDGLQCT